MGMIEIKKETPAIIRYKILQQSNKIPELDHKTTAYQFMQGLVNNETDQSMRYVAESIRVPFGKRIIKNAASVRDMYADNIEDATKFKEWIVEDDFASTRLFPPKKDSENGLGIAMQRIDGVWKIVRVDALAAKASLRDFLKSAKAVGK